MDDQLAQAALDYHRFPSREKSRSCRPRRMTNQRDLSLAYSPGRCRCLHGDRRDPLKPRATPSRGNLVAVITNGTAVLGLGNIGALAGKPVMEGKGCLFKKFAGIDVFDIEIDETDRTSWSRSSPAWSRPSAASTSRTSRRPSASRSRRRLRERMKIPVFHDDQHGTAIVAGAALLNGLKVVGKRIERGQAGLLRRRRRGARLPRPAGRPGRAQGEHLRHRQQGRGLRGPHRVHGPAEGALRRRRLDARTLAEVDRRGRRLPRPVGRRRAEAGDGRSAWRRGR